MSLLEKAVAAITPSEDQEAREKARIAAMNVAEPGDWLSQVIHHHIRLEVGFAAVKSAEDAPARIKALTALGVLLTGHAIAEESVLYPALAQVGEKGHADRGYSEQAEVKMRMAGLGDLDPMGAAYLDKLEEIRGMVAHHMYEEEGNWFLELREKASIDVQDKLDQQFREEFERYIGDYADGDRLPVEPQPDYRLTSKEDLMARAERSTA